MVSTANNNLATPSPELLKQIAMEHLDQLSQFGKLRVPSRKERDPDEPKLTFDILAQWTRESLETIQAGVTNCVYGGSPGSQIDFNNAFVAFMESMAMYLRKDHQMIEAVEAFRAGDADKAFSLWQDSTSDISKLAEMWGMTFVQICDLVDEHPDGHVAMVGPFCGGFISKNSKSTFMGVAFKGTSTLLEWINDVASILTIPAPDGHLWGQDVASGFYIPAFTTYGGRDAPYQLIMKAIQRIQEDSKLESFPVHVTGHSLGAAYATLTFAELTRNNSITKGDLYTFGSPRVALEGLPKQLSENLKTGSAWRIVNNRDTVTHLPPSIPWPWPLCIIMQRFTHVDSSYVIYPDSRPVKGPSEIRNTYLGPPDLVTRAPEPYGWLGGLTDHGPYQYYASLRFALGRPLGDSDTLLQELEKTVTRLRGETVFKLAAMVANETSTGGTSDLTSTAGCTHSMTGTLTLDVVNNCARGTISLSPLVGEIMGRCGTERTSIRCSVTASCLPVKDLHSRRTVFRSGNSSQIQFIDKEAGLVAIIEVSDSDSVVGIEQLAGTCTWSLDRKMLGI